MKKIYPDTELGKARAALYMLLPDEWKCKSLGDMAWDLNNEINVGTFVTLLSPSAEPRHFNIENAHLVLMEQVGIPEEKADKVKKVLTTIYDSAPKTPHKIRKDQNRRHYPDTELGRARQAFYHLLPEEMKRLSLTKIAERLGTHSDVTVSLMGDTAAPRTFNVGSEYKKMMNSGIFSEEKGLEVCAALENIHKFSQKKPEYENNAVGNARKALYELLATQSGTENLKEMYKKLNTHTIYSSNILSPYSRSAPTFSVKTVRDALVKSFNIPEEKSKELYGLLTTIRSRAGKNISENRER